MKEQDIFEKSSRASLKEKANIEYMDTLQEELSDIFLRLLPKNSPNYNALFLDELDAAPPSNAFRRIYTEALWRKDKRRKKVIRIACATLILLFSSSLLAGYIVRYPAVANKIQELLTLDISDPSIKITKPDPNIGDSEFYATYAEFTTLKTLKNAKSAHPELCMPNWLPSGYKHVKLTIIDDSYNFNMVWEFVSRENDLLVIMQYGTNTPVVISAVLDEVERQKILDGLLP